MTQEEILEYNKRCSELLGYKYSSSDKDFYFVEHIKTKKLLELNFESRFLSDWNWIEEVLFEIENKSFSYILKSDVYGDERMYSLEFYDKEGEPVFSTFKTYSSKKEAVVQSINQFLIWYKTNKL